MYHNQQWQQEGTSTGSWGQSNDRGNQRVRNDTDMVQQSIYHDNGAMLSSYSSGNPSIQTEVHPGSSNSLAGALGSADTLQHGFHSSGSGLPNNQGMLDQSYSYHMEAGSGVANHDSTGLGFGANQQFNILPSDDTPGQQHQLRQQNLPHQQQPGPSALAAFSQPNLDLSNDHYGRDSSQYVANSQQGQTAGSSHSNAHHANSQSFEPGFGPDAESFSGGHASASFANMSLDGRRPEPSSHPPSQEQTAGLFGPGALPGQDSFGSSGVWQNNADVAPSQVEAPSANISNALQRPNKPSALKISRSSNSFGEDGVANGYDEQIRSPIGQGEKTPSRTTSEVTGAGLNGGNSDTPQARARFVSLPQFQPSMFENATRGAGELSGSSSVPASQRQVDMRRSSVSSQGQFYQGGEGGDNESFASSRSNSTGGPGQAQIDQSHLTIPPSPISPSGASNNNFAPHVSPGSTLSGAFSSQPGSRPGSQGLKSVASFTSSADSLPGHDGISRPRSTSSGAAGRHSLTMTRSGSGLNPNEKAQYSPSAGPSTNFGTPPQLQRHHSLQSGLTIQQQQMSPQDQHGQQHMGAHPMQGVNLDQKWSNAEVPNENQSFGQDFSQQVPVQSQLHFQLSNQPSFSSLTSASPQQQQPHPHQASYFPPSPNFGQNLGGSSSDPFDASAYSEHRLSAALASGAQISSSNPSANRDGHSTPTIMEEEEDFGSGERQFGAAIKQEAPRDGSNHQLFAFQQQQQRHQFQLQSQMAHRHPNDLHSQHHQQQQQQQQQQQLHHHHHHHHQHHQQQHHPQHIQHHQHRQHHQQPPHHAPMGPGGMNGDVPQQGQYQISMKPSLYQQMSMVESSQLRGQQTVGMDGNIGDCSPFIQDIVRQYLSTPSRLTMGERNVLIMTTKVAQKSYGAEKRFLCPPPMVLLIGSSWWNVCPDASRPPPFQMQGQMNPDQIPTVLSPPRLTINISGEPGVQDGALEWASSSGRLIDVGNPSSEMAISGRCIGKQLFISDVDEKRRHVEALVSISVPGATPIDRHLLGTFASKPIKVISKPSKKRQSSRNTELCVNHGSVISLFHRLRSQTVSTRYLCVSGAPSWFKGSDNQPFLNMNPSTQNRNEPPSCFVAKMSSWDPFIIYLVDPKKRADAASSTPMQPPVKGYPPPPPNALPTSGLTSSQMTVHYNQPIVLQCLNTAVVSPVMVVRKVEKGTTVLGGGSAGASHFSREAFGDPVSQLHKIALEVLEDSSAAVPRPISDSGETLSPGTSGPFLACLNESVGMHRPSEARKWVASAFSVPSTPTTPVTPMNASASGDFDMSKPMGSLPTSPTAVAAAYAAAQTRFSMASSRHSSMFSPSPASTVQVGSMDPPISSDGGKVKRPRRVSSSVVVQKERAANAAKNRRRGQSLSVVGMQNQQNENDQLRRSTSYANSLTNSESSAAGSVAPGAMWSVDVADSDIWTVVGTDIARHSFYVPPRIVGGSQPKTSVADSSIAHLITVPAPAQPITPIPLLHNVVAPARDARKAPGSAETGVVTLFGENLHPNLFVFFGDWKSERVEVRSRETMVCTPPPPFEQGGIPRGRVPILLVRHDGIVFPTDLHYNC